MSWCSLRHARWTLTDLRRLYKREDIVDVHLFSRDYHFVYETLDHRLAFFKRECLQMSPQEVPKGFGMVDHLLPMHRLLFGVGPRVMQVGYHLWLLQHVTERLPDDRIKPVSPDAP